MTAYRFIGFYPSHYDTPTGSEYVNPGDIIDWDTPPDSWWVAVTDSVTESVAAPAPTMPPPRQPEPAPAPAAKTAKE